MNAIWAARRAEIAAGRRTCLRCGEVKPLGDFYRREGRPGIMAECSACFRDRMAKLRLLIGTPVTKSTTAPQDASADGSRPSRAAP